MGTWGHYSTQDRQRGPQGPAKGPEPRALHTKRTVMCPAKHLHGCSQAVGRSAEQASGMLPRSLEPYPILVLPSQKSEGALSKCSPSTRPLIATGSSRQGGLLVVSWSSLRTVLALEVAGMQHSTSPGTLHTFLSRPMHSRS